MSGVKRYSEQEIADAWTRYRMAIKGGTVPDATMFVRAEHFERVTMMLVQAQHERQAEHDLRVTMQARAETAEGALKTACDLLSFAQDNYGPIGPYASEAEASYSRHKWTDIDTFLYRYRVPPAPAEDRP